MPTKFKLLLFFLFTLSAYPALAQDSLKFVPGSPYYSEFCVLFRKLAKMPPSEMEAIGKMTGITDSSVLEVRDDYKFPGARYGVVRKSPVSYRTVLMVRDNKEQLKSSYHNLVHQVQDCLVEEAMVKEKKFMNRDLYSTTITPGMAEEMPYGVEIQVSIEFNLRTLLNELVLVITPASKEN